MLLRLRQACCHPHLIKDFEKATDEDAPQGQKAHIDALLDNLLEDIIRRLIANGEGNWECPICMDVSDESVIMSVCGHVYCRACITGKSLAEMSIRCSSGSYSGPSCQISNDTVAS